MSTFPIKVKPFGEEALLLEWPAKMSEDILENILSVYQKIKQHSHPFIIDTLQSINSITIIFDSNVFNRIQMEQWIKGLDTSTNFTFENRHRWTIPVCYNHKFAPDIQALSARNNLPVDKIIALHSSSPYRIYSIGFLPGFLYLGGLDKRLHIPRKGTPTLSIPKGAVGIGGQQTGIYPVESPAGWHIIGRTPILLFEKEKSNPCFAKPGDQIQFKAISEDEYKAIEIAVSDQTYKIKKEVIGD